jgi:hypothetical protein
MYPDRVWVISDVVVKAIVFVFVLVFGLARRLRAYQLFSKGEYP